MIKTITVITSIQSVWVTRPSRSDLGAIRACLGPVCRAWHKFCSFKASMRQYKYELICFRTTFCFANFSAPFNRTKMVLYSKCVYGSQFSGEENDLKIRSLVAEISIKNPVSFFLGHPVYFPLPLILSQLMRDCKLGCRSVGSMAIVCRRNYI